MLVNNATPALFTINSISLKPGINTVKGSEWLEARKHPSVKKRMDAGLIIEETEIDEESGEENLDGYLSEEDLGHLLQLKQNQATALVKETFDMELLQGWLERENRNQVKGVIKKQIALLEEEPTLRDRSAARQIDSGKGVEVIDIPTPKATKEDD